MAVYSNQKIAQLESYAQAASWARNIRYAFYFYAFLSFLFWFLNCLEVDLYRFNGLFLIPYRMVREMGYKADGLSIDFSLVIIGFISLAIGAVIDFASNKAIDIFLDKAEEEEERLERKRRQKQRQKTSSQVANSTVSSSYEIASNVSIPAVQESPFEDSKLLFIIQPHINKIKRKESDLELTFQEVELWKQRVNKKLIENVNYSKPMQKGYYRKNLFLMYKDFNYVDDFVYYIKPTVASIIMEFQKYGILVNFNYVLSAIANIDTLEKELDCMDTILSLNFKGEYILTNRFKITYDNKPIQQYEMKLKGEYNLSKNLSITNRQPLYALLEKKQEESRQ